MGFWFVGWIIVVLAGNFRFESSFDGYFGDFNLDLVC